MVAWMDRDGRGEHAATGLTHFWSRSRQAPWRKGETSGHVQHVQGVYADCDADTLLVQVHQDGVACHTGTRTCFFTALQGPGAAGRHARPHRADRGRAQGGAAGRLVRGRAAGQGRGRGVPQDRRGGGGGRHRRARRRGRPARGRGGGRPLVPHHGAARRAVDPAARRARGAGAPARGADGARSVEPRARCAGAPLGAAPRRAARARRRAAAAGAIENGVYHAPSGYRVTLPRDGWVVEP